jgi:hypothetical protein
VLNAVTSRTKRSSVPISTSVGKLRLDQAAMPVARFSQVSFDASR